MTTQSWHRWCLSALAGFILAGQMGAAIAASDPDTFSLFNGIRKDVPGFFGLDLNPATLEVEPMDLDLSSCTASAPDAGGLITVTQKVSINARSSDGAVSAFKTVPAASLTSGLFPDPRIAANQCGGVNEAEYDTSYETIEPTTDLNCVPPGDSLEFCFEFPHGPFVGLGIAEKSSTKVVIVGVALKGVVERPNFADISRYSVTAYNMNGSRRWTRTIPQNSGGGRMFADWGLVGDLLGGDGSDEIRVVYMLEPGLRYVYYDVLTGALIKSVNVNP